uniref:Uncharacterized protein n=1 Tax=Anguilla anguilla TaxID=7936 RepID=A0A0E9TUF1_ANGAN
MAAFWLQAAQILQYSAGICWRGPACALLRSAGGLGLDRQLFLMELAGLNTAGISTCRCWRLGVC